MLHLYTVADDSNLCVVQRSKLLFKPFFFSEKYIAMNVLCFPFRFYDLNLIWLGRGIFQTLTQSFWKIFEYLWSMRSFHKPPFFLFTHSFFIDSFSEIFFKHDYFFSFFIHLSREFILIVLICLLYYSVYVLKVGKRKENVCEPMR